MSEFDNELNNIKLNHESSNEIELEEAQPYYQQEEDKDTKKKTEKNIGSYIFYIVVVGLCLFGLYKIVWPLIRDIIPLFR